jgi:hypothetical protein
MRRAANPVERWRGDLRKLRRKTVPCGIFGNRPWNNGAVSPPTSLAIDQRRPEPRSNKPIRIPARTAATGPRKSVKSHWAASSERFSLTSGTSRPEMKAAGMGYARDGPDRDAGQAPTITISIKYSRFAALLRWEKQRYLNLSPPDGGRGLSVSRNVEWRAELRRQVSLNQVLRLMKNNVCVRSKQRSFAIPRCESRGSIRLAGL